MKSLVQRIDAVLGLEETKSVLHQHVHDVGKKLGLKPTHGSNYVRYAKTFHHVTPEAAKATRAKARKALRAHGFHSPLRHLGMPVPRGHYVHPSGSRASIGSGSRKHSVRVVVHHNG